MKGDRVLVLKKIKRSPTKRERERMHSSPSSFCWSFKGFRASEGPSLTGEWEEGLESAQNLEKALGERSWQQRLHPDSEQGPGCLFWRPGSRTAAATSFAASMQGKAGKIPQSDIVSACGQVRTPNLDSGIWWENGKCIRVTEGT